MATSKPQSSATALADHVDDSVESIAGADGSVITKTTKTETTYWIDERDGLLPWPWWKIAPIALLATAALIGASTLWAVNHIQNTLEEATRADLEAQGIDTSRLNIDYSYRDGTISGDVAEGVSAADLEGAVDDDGIRNLSVDVGNFQIEAEEEEAETEAEEDDEPQMALETGPMNVGIDVSEDGSIVLTGTVHSQEQADELVAAAVARFGADNVDDQLVVSGLREGTPGAGDRVAYMTGLISELPDGIFGQASVNDTRVAGTWNASNVDPEADLSSFGQPTPDSTLGNQFVANQPASAAVEAVSLQEQFDEIEVEVRETVVFETGSDVLVAGATETLDKVVAVLQEFELPTVVIEGHTDSDGDDGINQQLSQDRAQAVVDYLIEQGIDESRLTASGFGETDPIADNATAEGRAENRRVELVASAS